MNKEGGKSLQRVGGIKIGHRLSPMYQRQLPILKDFGERKYGEETSQKERTETGKSMSLVPACPLLDSDDLGAILASDEGGFPKGGSNILFTH